MRILILSTAIAAGLAGQASAAPKIMAKLNGTVEELVYAATINHPRFGRGPDICILFKHNYALFLKINTSAITYAGSEQNCQTDQYQKLDRGYIAQLKAAKALPPDFPNTPQGGGLNYLNLSIFLSVILTALGINALKKRRKRN